MSLPRNLDRLTALRPARTPVPAGETHPADAAPGTLLETLVGGEMRPTARGQHLVAECRLADPAPCAPPRRALRLLCHSFPERALEARHWLFLDTETTGLAGGTGTYAFLVGVAWWDDDAFVVRQLFMRDPRDEASLLWEFREILDQRNLVVTFNGKSFDWPLLETRFRMTRSGSIPDPGLHLDLLHPARQLWRLRVGSAALAELERSVLSLRRDTDIPSETIPRIYFDYLRGGPAGPVAQVFRHNRMDLVGLASLAARMLSLLEDPEADGSDAAELFGISRMLQRRGESERAAGLYERALRLGLPPAAAAAARRELALSAKRSRDFPRATALWTELLVESRDDIRACEELAIHYEHRERDTESAARLTREALVRLREAYVERRIMPERYRRFHDALQHRLARLLRKQLSVVSSQ